VPSSFTLSGLRFSQPVYLWLLVLPAVLLAAWTWQAWRRRSDIRQMRKHRHLPGRHATRERLPLFGDLVFWLCLTLALASTIIAIARPVAVASMVRTSGIDLVILQDGSASMRVRDVAMASASSAGTRVTNMDRWRRSMMFLRTFGESLQWEDDRVALALFATIATPQVRLTRDPNTFFFFLDHLEDQPPFRIEDDTTWDTNIERGIYWGLRLIDKDAEMNGGSPAPKGPAPKPGPMTPPSMMRAQAPRLSLEPGPPPKLSSKPRAFMLVSDGKAWSGSVAKSIDLAQARHIPLFVVGVGTTAGGVIPEPNREPGRAAVSSALDRASLAVIATAGGGQYFEIGRETDRDIANTIIDSTRRRATAGTVDESVRDLYWMALFAAAWLLGIGVLFLRDRASLALQLTAAVVAIVTLASLT
jgi:hypothetical protein